MQKNSVVFTVEPLNKGHVGVSHFVLCIEVVHSSEVQNVFVGKWTFGTLRRVHCICLVLLLFIIVCFCLLLFVIVHVFVGKWTFGTLRCVLFLYWRFHCIILFSSVIDCFCFYCLLLFLFILVLSCSIIVVSPILLLVLQITLLQKYSVVLVTLNYAIGGLLVSYCMRW